MSEDLRKDLIGRQFATTILFDDPALGIPAQVDNYHSLYPLETPSLEPGSVFGFSSILYKGINVGDGLPYAMRRMVNVKLTDVAAMDVVERWKKIQHPNVIAIKEVFTTKDFGDNCAGHSGFFFVLFFLFLFAAAFAPRADGPSPRMRAAIVH